MEIIIIGMLYTQQDYRIIILGLSLSVEYCKDLLFTIQLQLGLTVTKSHSSDYNNRENSKQLKLWYNIVLCLSDTVIVIKK